MHWMFEACVHAKSFVCSYTEPLTQINFLKIPLIVLYMQCQFYLNMCIYETIFTGLCKWRSFWIWISICLFFTYMCLFLVMAFVIFTICIIPVYSLCLFTKQKKRKNLFCTFWSGIICSKRQTTGWQYLVEATSRFKKKVEF